MSNISKNLLLGLTLVCAIVLIVFCIQLIVLNRGVNPAEQGPVISGSSQSDDPGGEDTDEEGDGEDDISNANIPSAPRPPPQGTRREVRVSQSNLLIVYSRDELFDFEERDFDWWFLYTGGGLATLEIKHTMISPQGIESHALAFLEQYTGGADAVFNGEGSIGGSDLRGHHVTARRGNETFEAWIHILLDSDLALAFVICYENDQQKDALYEVLSTLTMEALQLPATGTGGADAASTDAGDAGTGDGDTEPDDDGSQGDRPVVS